MSKPIKFFWYPKIICLAGFGVAFCSFRVNKCLWLFFRSSKTNDVSFYLNQGVSVEAVDPVFQAKMLDMLKQTGR